MGTWKFYGDWKTLEAKAEALKEAERQRVRQIAQSYRIEISSDAADQIIESAKEASIALGTHISPDDILFQFAKGIAEQTTQADLNPAQVSCYPERHSSGVQAP